MSRKLLIGLLVAGAVVGVFVFLQRRAQAATGKIPAPEASAPPTKGRTVALAVTTQTSPDAAPTPKRGRTPVAPLAPTVTAPSAPTFAPEVSSFRATTTSKPFGSITTQLSGFTSRVGSALSGFGN